jgi:flagella basal body P-ring formation protein FlgA
MKKLYMLVISVLLFSSPAVAQEGELAGVLKTFLRDHYPWADLEIKDLRLSVSAPAGRPSAIVVEQAPPGKTIFLLNYPDGKKIIATAIVKAFDSVVMSRRALNKNAILQKEDIYTALADTSRIQKGAVRNEEEVLSKGLTRGIGPNVVITEVMVSQFPEVKKGQKVMLVVDAPGFSIRGAGELQQGGFVGNYVKVISGQSNKAITGLLVDEHTVKVGL